MTGARIPLDFLACAFPRLRCGVGEDLLDEGSETPLLVCLAGVARDPPRGVAAADALS